MVGEGGAKVENFVPISEKDAQVYGATGGSVEESADLEDWVAAEGAVLGPAATADQVVADWDRVETGELEAETAVGAEGRAVTAAEAAMEEDMVETEDAEEAGVGLVGLVEAVVEEELVGVEAAWVELVAVKAVGTSKFAALVVALRRRWIFETPIWRQENCLLIRRLRSRIFPNTKTQWSVFQGFLRN